MRRLGRLGREHGQFLPDLEIVGIECRNAAVKIDGLALLSEPTCNC